jgi:DNA polymerase-4
MKHPQSPSLILHVRLDSFLASIEEARRPEWSGRPIVVTATQEANQPILGVNHLARRLGLRPGLQVAQALRLCPLVVSQQLDIEEAERRSRSFFALLLRYADRIEPRLLDEAFIDLSEERFAKSQPVDLAISIQRTIERELGLTASIGIGRTKATAFAASAHKRPNGLTVVQPGDERAFLYPLPLQRLYSVGERARSFLQKHGVATIGQLAAASTEWLHQEFRDAGIHWQEEARGQEADGIEPIALTKSLSRTLTFDQPVRDVSWMLSAAQHLTEKAVRSLKSQKRSAEYAILRLTDNEGRTHQQRLELRDLRSREVFQPAVRSAILRTIGLTMSIRSITVSFERLETRGAAQSSALWNGDRIQAALRGLRGRVEGFGARLLDSRGTSAKLASA